MKVHPSLSRKSYFENICLTLSFKNYYVQKSFSVFKMISHDQFKSAQKVLKPTQYFWTVIQKWNRRNEIFSQEDFLQNSHSNTYLGMIGREIIIRWQACIFSCIFKIWSQEPWSCHLVSGEKAWAITFCSLQSCSSTIRAAWRGRQWGNASVNNVLYRLGATPSARSTTSFSISQTMMHMQGRL